MKLRVGLQVVLLFLAVAVCSFDRHLAYYYPGDLAMLVSPDTLPAHTDLPVPSCDYHEDIAVKGVYCIIPAPFVLTIHAYRAYQQGISLISPHMVWQPPENNS